MKPPGSSQQEEEAAVASPGSQSSVIYRQLSSETCPPELHPQGPPHPTLLPRGASLQQVCGYSQLPQPRPSFLLLSIKLLTVLSRPLGAGMELRASLELCKPCTPALRPAASSWLSCFSPLGLCFGSFILCSFYPDFLLQCLSASFRTFPRPFLILLLSR